MRKVPHFGGGLRMAGDVRRDVEAANRDSFALSLWRALMQSHFGKLRLIANDAQTAAMVTV